MASTLATGLFLASWLTATPEQEIAGTIKYYDPGLMAQVAANRGIIPHKNLYFDWLKANNLDGAISGMRYGDIGRRALLVVPGHIPLRVMIIDCEKQEEYQRRVEQGDIAEVDWSIAARLGMRGPIEGRLVFKGSGGRSSNPR